MSVRSIVYIVASPRPRVGKTLLARLLTDFQRQNERPIAAFDLFSAGPALAEFLPGEAVAASIDDVPGQMALFDRLVADDGVTKVVDLGHDRFEPFFRIARDIGFAEEAHRRGIAPVVLYIGTPDRTAVEAYAALRPQFPHGTLVPVHNEILGNAQARGKFPPSGTASVHLPVLAPGLRRVIDRRPFSFHDMPASGRQAVPREDRHDIEQWLRRAYLEFREMELAVLLADLQSALQAQS